MPELNMQFMCELSWTERAHDSEPGRLGILGPGDTRIQFLKWAGCLSGTYLLVQCFTLVLQLDQYVWQFAQFIENHICSLWW